MLAGGEQIAGRTSLAPNETRTLTVQAAAADAVAVTETATGYEITSGLTGIRLPQPVTAPTDSRRRLSRRKWAVPWQGKRGVRDLGLP